MYAVQGPVHCVVSKEIGERVVANKVAALKGEVVLPPRETEMLRTAEVTPLDGGFKIIFNLPEQD
jgi:hypothetical protein